MIEGCIFCQIVSGQAQASFVHQDDAVVAFLDIQPITPGHLLVVPREHVERMGDLRDLTAARVFQVAGRLAGALRRSGLRCEGINLFVMDGEAAFQDVPHFHVHVIPRFKGDGFGLTFPPGYGREVQRSELEALAAAVRAVVAPA
ncbi:MAG TPA: HIT family protein [Candidatus Acidoferrales bacterium]|nr:HIT family protein [Candidatus Acidoferrales bacterium]